MEANALVFHASLSVFDQYIEDDPLVSRLEDTYMFWTVICKSRLISKVLPPSHLVVSRWLTVVRWSFTDTTNSSPKWM
jgi:hypothetical protein